MALRIACDLDGTLADMERALQREAQALFGPDVDLRAGVSLPLVPPSSTLLTESPDDGAAATVADAASLTPAKRPLTNSERRRLWAQVGQIESFWQNLSEVEPGAVARLAAVARQHRWEVLFITQRPDGAGETTQRQSQRWLSDHGFELPAVYVIQGSRGMVASALSLDAVVDDRPDNCLDIVSDSEARAILVWRDDPALVPPAARRLGITVAPSFDEALVHLDRMMVARQKSGRLIDRIRTAIGF